jgi:polyisoprenoid-binding protein YceI
MKNAARLTLVFALMPMAGPHPRAAVQDPDVLPAIAELSVEQGSVSVRCPLTVGGGFDAKTSALTGELVLRPDQPGAVGGTVSVDLRTLQTGIRLRDDHMRTKYLEVQRGPRYAEATLAQIQLENADLSRPKSTAQFRGVLTLHGQDREVAGVAHIRHSGSGLHVEATFPVRSSQFQIPTPSYLGVGVKDEVSVHVTLQIAWPAVTHLTSRSRDSVGPFQ